LKERVPLREDPEALPGDESDEEEVTGHPGQMESPLAS
jgi:hypothetical protein